MKLATLELNYKIQGQPTRTSAVDYFRLIQPSTFIKRNTDWEVSIRKEIFSGHPEKNWQELMKAYDIVFTQYNIDSPAAYVQMAFWAQKYDTQIVLDIDDNLWELDPSNPVYTRFHTGSVDLERLTSIVQHVPHITCTNPYLKQMIGEHTGRYHNIHVLDNAIDFNLYSTKRTEHEGIVLFYHGSQTHLKDIHEEAFQKGLERIMDEYPQVNLHMMGMFSLEYQMKYKNRYIFIGGHSHYPDYLKEFNTQVEIADIAVVPLESSSFTKSKSGLKRLEYAAAKLPTVLSNRYQYRKLTTSGVDGFLCDTAEDWYTYLKLLIENPQKREEIGQKGYETIKKIRNIETYWVHYKKYFEDILQ